MAFPTFIGQASVNGTSAVVNKTVNLPTARQAGDVALIFLRSGGSDSHTTPAGWTSLVLNNGADASNDISSIWWKVLDGSEANSFTVTCTTSQKYASVSLVYRNAGMPQISAIATGTSTTPNPPSFTPSGGAQDYVWIWAGGWEGTQTSPPAGNPTNYTVRASANTGAGGTLATNCRLALADRQLNAASEDPPSWTISASDDWSAWTLAIPPPNIPTRARVSAAEFEVPDSGVSPTRARVSAAEFEVPDSGVSPTRARVSWARLEVPFVPTRARMSWAEFQIPNVPTRARISWSELEVPTAPTRMRVSWSELEAPFVPTRARMSWAEFEAPAIPTRVRISWAAFEVVDAEGTNVVGPVVKPTAWEVWRRVRGRTPKTGL